MARHFSSLPLEWKPHNVLNDPAHGPCSHRPARRRCPRGPGHVYPERGIKPPAIDRPDRVRPAVRRVQRWPALVLPPALFEVRAGNVAVFPSARSSADSTTRRRRALPSKCEYSLRLQEGDTICAGDIARLICRPVPARRSLQRPACATHRGRVDRWRRCGLSSHGGRHSRAAR